MVSFGSILRAAVQTFSAKGYAATGIRDIASAAGVTSGTLYLYAPSKMAILDSVMNLTLDELLRLAEVATAGERTPAVRLERLIRAHVAIQATNPRTALVVDGELRFVPAEHRSAIVSKRDAYERYWTETLAAGVETGDFAVVEPSITRLSLLEMGNGVAHWYQPDGPLDLGRILDVFVRLGFNLVGHPGPVRGADSDLSPRRLDCEPDDRVRPGETTEPTQVATNAGT